MKSLWRVWRSMFWICCGISWIGVSLLIMFLGIFCGFLFLFVVIRRCGCWWCRSWRCGCRILSWFGWFRICWCLFVWIVICMVLKIWMLFYIWLRFVLSLRFFLIILCCVLGSCWVCIRIIWVLLLSWWFLMSFLVFGIWIICRFFILYCSIV